MRVFTVHLRPRAAPVLVPEGFSWGAAVFGPLWLLGRGAWVPGVLALCADITAWSLVGGLDRMVLLVLIAWMLGVFGHDLRRWSLGRAGFGLAHVVAARNEDAALARLLHARPELAREAMA